LYGSNQLLAKNKLKLNENKTEAILISSKYDTHLHDTDTIIIGQTTIALSNKVKDLGVILDKHLSMVAHISNMSSTASYAIRKIGKIRQYLDNKSTETLVHAFVTSRLDYCNSVLYGLPVSQLSRLQRVQNTAARLVTRTDRRSHITPVLRALHWLPIKDHITFKIALLTYKALHDDTAPAYLSDLVEWYDPPRMLRSSSTNLIKPRRPRTKQYSRGFDVAGAPLYGTLCLLMSALHKP
jgi:hypothetical protein